MARPSKAIAFQSIVAIVAAAFCIQCALSQEEVQCRGQELNMTVPQKAVIQDCLTEAGITSIWKIPLSKLSCFGVCVLEKKNMLKDGMLDHEKILTYINDVMKPDDIKKPLIEGTDKCIKEHGSKVKADNDPNCLSFTDVGQCVHEVFLDICLE